MRSLLLVAIAATQWGCGCPARDTGLVTDLTDTVQCCGATNIHMVTSPRPSNLDIALTWTDPSADLNLRVSVVNCINPGGCPVRTSANPVGTTNEQLGVDGTPGLQWRVEVLGDPRRAIQYRLMVTYDTGTCT